MIEAQLLSKVIDEDKFFELTKHNVNAEDFPTLSPVYQFVKDRVADTGHVPDYRTVAAEFPDFEYYPEVSDGFKYLSARLKSQAAKRFAFDLLQHKAKEKFKELDGSKFVDWLGTEVGRIQQTTAVSAELGTNFATNGEERKSWYTDAKEKRTFRFIPTPYRSLTEALGGGFEIGDYVLLMAFTNRGKSWIASDIGLKGWISGFGVLHYSPELSREQQALRLDTLCGHFNNVQIRRGTLSATDEKRYFDDYLTKFSEGSKWSANPYIIKTMEDLPNGLSIDVIEADLQMNPNVRMVIIDGFNLMRHSGKGRSGHEAKEESSRRLRQVFGRYKVVGAVIHQTPGAAEKESSRDEDKTRLVKPPKLTDYSGTIAVIQDAATVLTFDQAEGIGKLAIEKAREPSVGQVIELACNFNLGYIKEQDATALF